MALGAPAVRGDSILIDQNRRALIELGVSEEIVAKYMAALAELYGRIIAGDESYGIAAAALWQHLRYVRALRSWQNGQRNATSRFLPEHPKQNQP